METPMYPGEDPAKVAAAEAEIARLERAGFANEEGLKHLEAIDRSPKDMGVDRMIGNLEAKGIGEDTGVDDTVEIGDEETHDASNVSDGELDEAVGMR